MTSDRLQFRDGRDFDSESDAEKFAAWFPTFAEHAGAWDVECVHVGETVEWYSTETYPAFIRDRINGAAFAWEANTAGRLVRWSCGCEGIDCGQQSIVLHDCCGDDYPYSFFTRDMTDKAVAILSEDDADALASTMRGLLGDAARFSDIKRALS